MCRLELVDTLVTHANANAKGFGLTYLSGVWLYASSVKNKTNKWFLQKTLCKWVGLLVCKLTLLTQKRTVFLY